LFQNRCHIPSFTIAKNHLLDALLVNHRHQLLWRRSTLHHLISTIITDRTPKLLSLEKEELMVGVRERQDERKFFNNWPQPRIRRRKGSREKVMSVAQRKSGEESVEDRVELVEEGFTDTAMVFACENWSWNGGVGECLVQLGPGRSSRPPWPTFWRSRRRWSGGWRRRA